MKAAIELLADRLGFTNDQTKLNESIFKKASKEKADAEETMNQANENLEFLSVQRNEILSAIAVLTNAMNVTKSIDDATNA